MRLKKIETFSDYAALVENFKRRGTLTNDYIQLKVAEDIAHGSLFYSCKGENAFVFVTKDGFHRLYYYLNDLSVPVDFLTGQFVTEILFRTEIIGISREIEYLKSCGFEENLVRDQYFAKYSSIISTPQPEGLRIDTARSLGEVQWAVDLFNSSFDKWSGDYISRDLCALLLNEQTVLTCKDKEGILLGACQVESQRGIHWLRHLAVTGEARRKGVGTALLNAYIVNGHHDDESRYMLWVQRNNYAAVDMYKKKGFSYLGKSSLSMIKL
ncbi:MAG: GNAT family N-acetyltransferase [Candidatus Cryptobacteroides sp.]|jgi:GNAT superfamily N-acetyltransferase